jgi:SAP domain-containing new25
VRSLSTKMSLAEFDNGYWYAIDLARFAEKIGVPSAKKLRKDELEKAIKAFLATGRIESPTKRALSKSGVKDIDRGLGLDLPVVHYTSNKATKAFLAREAEKLSPGFKPRSGARYRLNRWREEQLTRGKRITYRDLVEQYVALSRSEEPFARIPHGRYINFLADFLAHEPGATREGAIRAWKKLKGMEIPKDYRSWKKTRGQTS